MKGKPTDDQILKAYSVMSTVSLINSLEYKKDVKLLTVGDQADFTNYLISNQNKTKYGVIFCFSE